MAIVLIGTLDTKGRELGYVRDTLHQLGLSTIVADVGSIGPPTLEADYDRDAVFHRAGTSLAEVLRRSDRGFAVDRAAEGIRLLVSEWHAAGCVDGVIGIGGSAGTVIASSAMRGLPFGVPKVLVSTLASGSTRPFVGGSDIIMFASVADIAGLNRLTTTTLGHAARAMAGMVARGPEPSIDPEAPAELPGTQVEAGSPAEATRPPAPSTARRRVVAATMFGVTTPCVDRARALVEARCPEVEVLVFHATGVGGQAMESLIRDGEVDAVLDLTTTELADELVGGILSAGPERLRAAIDRGLPQVISVGALDMVNFGPPDSVPARFDGRRFHSHNASVTLMRTSTAENAELGRHLARVVRRSTVPVAVLLPLGGVSALSVPGGTFHDPDADRALFSTIREGLAGCSMVEVIDHPESINHPSFAEEATTRLFRLWTQIQPRSN